MNKAKILLILNIPPPYGGGEIRAKILYDYFIGRNNFVVVTNSNKNSNKATQGKLNIRNIILNIYYQFSNAFRIIREKPRVVYLSIPKGIIPLSKLVFVIIACKINKTKLLGELAGSHFYFLKKRNLAFFWGKFILSNFDEIRLLGDSIKTAFLDYGITNTVVFDNGAYIPDYFIPTPKKSIGKNVNLLFIGALHRAKGIFLLMDIAKLLYDKKIDYKLNILGEWGDEKDRKAVLNLLDGKSFAKRISFAGVQKGKTKWHMLNNSDIYLFPSYNEGQPISLIEAMSVGLPIIASNVGAIPDTMTNNSNGFIIDKFNPVSYVNKIEYLINNPSFFEKVSQYNIETYKTRFTLKKYCNSVDNWLQAHT